MEVTITELQGIAKTLPIGYYTKRPIPVTIKEKAETSYYSPLTDEICISLEQITNALNKAPDTYDKETLVRSNMYHEVSHAILTPTNLKINDVVNIFEDERIETLLQNFYLDTDFEADKYYMNGLEIGEVPPATSAINAFYNLVRFHSGTQTLLDRVDNLIKKYATITRECDRYRAYEYYNDIMRLYHEVEHDFSARSADSKDKVKVGTDPGGDEIIQSASGHGLEDMETKIEVMFRKASDRKLNKEIYEALSIILNNFKKKNSGGNSVRAYSGVINPRSIRYDDFRFFDRSISARSGNSFGSFHLNLFIDRSGSFWRSQDLVNQLLRTLTEIERKNANFSLDVVFCGEGQTKVDKVEDRIINCDGGNNLTADIFPLFRSLQLPKTYNYNIILFDGNAYSDKHPDEPTDGFRAFDTNNSTIITDSQNTKYIKDKVKKARVIYTDKYTDELLKNIYQVLVRAFQ